MTILTASFREHNIGLNCNLTDYCCERNTRILGEIQGFGWVGNKETDLQGCYSEQRNSSFLTF
jgi:hypothetical protein